MARTGWEGAGSGALSGGLGGGMSGAGVGMTFGGPPGALIGGAIGAGVGIIGGAITGALDAQEEAELERAMNEQQAAWDKAQNRFQANVSMAGDAASELVGQTMTAKNAQDVAKADSVMEEASRVADASGLIGAEKADYLLKARESANKQSAASTPAVYQQAQQGAMAARGQEMQKAAMTLQSEQAQIGQEMQRLGAAELPDHTAALGQAMGSGAQMMMMGKAIQNQAPGATAKTPAAGGDMTLDRAWNETMADYKTQGHMSDATKATMEQLVAGTPDDFSGTPDDWKLGPGPGTIGETASPAVSRGGRAAPTQTAPTQTAPTQAAPTQAALGGEADGIPGYGSLVNPTGMEGLPYQSMDLISPDELAGASRPLPLTGIPQTVEEMHAGSGTLPQWKTETRPDWMKGGRMPTPPENIQGPNPEYFSLQSEPQALAGSGTVYPPRPDWFSGGRMATPPENIRGPDDPYAVDAFGNYQEGYFPTSQQELGVGANFDPYLFNSLRQQGFSGFASGGMAGTTGPEVAVLGEEGPELVLNAKQTAELATSLGGAEPYAMGGVAGAKKKLPGYAGGGVAGAGQSQFEMDPEEMLEYLRAFKDMKGAL